MKLIATEYAFDGSQVVFYVTAEGRVTNNWPGSQTEYKRRTRTLALADYLTTVPSPARTPA